jgi:pimeloyl-ACP methyl ester carboxylesterase
VTTSSPSYAEQTVELGGLPIHLLQGGAGSPVLVLSHDVGNPGWLPFHDGLAGRFSVTVPDYPGYGASPRADWMRSVRDLAVMQQWLLSNLALEDVSLIGLGFGGWVAAEMASMAPRLFRRLVLVGAMGLQPERGEILDQAILAHEAYVRAGFHDPARFDAVFGAEPSAEQLEAWDVHRETTFRIAWKPYMYSQTLPHLLGGVRAKTLLVWGNDDRIVPVECGEHYRDLLSDARLETVPACGHFVEMERPEALLDLVLPFLS